ncbi:hypothetical protein MRX96_036323 [Rhipicephalus microplus]
MTYAETNQFPLKLRAKYCALRHVERMHVTRAGEALVIQLLSLLHTGIRCSALQYAGLITASPVPGLLPIPPHWDSQLAISTKVLGIRSQGPTPRAALRQDTCTLIEEEYSDHLRRLGLTLRYTLRRAFHALLDVLGEADLIMRV